MELLDKNDLIKKLTLYLHRLFSWKELTDGTKYGSKEDIWEDIGRQLLNKVYGWELDDLNNKYHINFPGIDSGNENRSIGVQITIDKSTGHINDTIKKYQKGYKIGEEIILPNKYKNLKFFLVCEKNTIEKKYSYLIEKDGFCFTNKDIYTFGTIIKEAETRSYEEVQSILALLDTFYNGVPFENFLSDAITRNPDIIVSAIKLDKELGDKLLKHLKARYEEKGFSVTSKEINYTFKTFSDLYEFILKQCTRIRKHDLAEVEKNQFYFNIISDETLFYHFLDNLGILKGKELDSIIQKVLRSVIDKNPTYKNLLNILNYIEKYNSKKEFHLFLDLIASILGKAKEEFIFRKVAIILSESKVESKSNNILEQIADKIIKDGGYISHDFIIKFISQNIDKFKVSQVKALLKLFDFSDNKNIVSKISVPEYSRGEKYLPQIFEKVFELDYKLGLDFFSKLIIAKRKPKILNDIKTIPYFNFPEVELKNKRTERIEYSVFVSLGKYLDRLSKDKKGRILYIEIANYIIHHVDISVLFELLSFSVVNEQNDYYDIIESLVKKKEIRTSINIFQARWGEKIYGYYLKKNTDYIKEFEEEVLTISDDYIYYKLYLLKAIPDKALSNLSKKFLEESEAKLGHKLSFRNIPSIEVKTYSGRIEPLRVTFLENEKIEEIKNKIDIITSKESGWDLYDYSGIITSYSKNNLNQIEEIYSYIVSKGSQFYVLASLVINGFLEYSKEEVKKSGITIDFYINLIGVYRFINQDDTHSKLEIGRVLDDNEFLRDKFTEQIKTVDEDVYTGLKNIVIDLANDESPDKEDGDKDGLSLGLNSVRGLGTINTSLLFLYYPKDEDLKNQIIKLSKDKLYGIQATLISNLGYFINSNFDIVENMILEYLSQKNEILDSSIINYFLERLGWQSHKDLFIKILNWLLYSTDTDIQNKVGQMIGGVIFSGIEKDKLEIIKDYIEILNGIIEKRVGTYQTVLGVCFSIENSMVSKDISTLEKKIDIIFTILDNYKVSDNDLKEERISISYRLSFMFYDNMFPLNYFDTVYEKGLLNSLIKESKNHEAYSNINSYLERVLDKYGENKLDAIKQIMKLESDTSEDIFNEHSYTGIEKLLKILYEEYDGKNCAICNEIFEKGLERGRKEYKEIYYKYYA